jgi:N-acetyl-anhydromuramyl-L-alanine amidase AmpD
VTHKKQQQIKKKVNIKKEQKYNKEETTTPQRELLLYGHGIKVGFFAHHSQADSSAFQEKCTNLE